VGIAFAMQCPCINYQKSMKALPFKRAVRGFQRALTGKNLGQCDFRKPFSAYKF